MFYYSIKSKNYQVKYTDSERGGGGGDYSREAINQGMAVIWRNTVPKINKKITLKTEDWYHGDLFFGLFSIVHSFEKCLHLIVLGQW